MEQAVKILFILLLIAFPLGQIGRVELGGGVNILLNDIIVFLIVVAWLLCKLLIRKPISNELARPIFFFTTIALFTLIINQEWLTQQQTLISSLYLVRWISYAGLFFVVRSFDEKLQQKVLYGLLASGVATVIIGLLQYFFYPDLRNLFYAGWDEHLYRLFSSLLDPNFTGGILVLTFLLATSLTLNEKFSLARSHPFGLSPQGCRLARLGLFATLVSFIGILLTYSRGSFISFLFGSFTLLFLLDKKKLLAILLLGFAFGILVLPKNLKSEGVELLRTASIKQRIESSEHALAIFEKNPLFGVGYNAYRYAQQRLGFITSSEAEKSHAAAGTDNSFLFVLATTGIIGFAAYCYLWWSIIRRSLQQPLVLASIVAIFVHAFFVNSLFYPWVMEWLWVLLAAAKVQK